MSTLFAEQGQEILLLVQKAYNHWHKNEKYNKTGEEKKNKPSTLQHRVILEKTEKKGKKMRKQLPLGLQSSNARTCPQPQVLELLILQWLDGYDAPRSALKSSPGDGKRSGSNG